ncbi:DUF418 domain-containing protein [Brevibacillus laterosporus]|uniref:DUF418 domain-containing protein n=1 Tax=Brevibacillus laterosporus TaxID=1465 RepID=A0AAP8U4Y0_BRELA|nr:DUF418 domain-containing protein [Brevibacillus laterosporus]MBG9772781.1 threonyl-tRNA synthetase [Brevibacillus laterosporus]MBG9798267.1 threonyl-tRNA synthetase [Brevibacillus laterosporus]MCR8936873.1 DUF1624 domain-containing protein [Brevibacillus laterosporus]MCZ0839511.1 DUF418 domain-containing protein [Brevibacillus laterosporus]MCZ0847628.1 DUF418 domain-containing protein [Brevibacillus laterosporus]
MSVSNKLLDESGSEYGTGASIEDVVSSKNNRLRNNAVAGKSMGRLVALDAARGLAVIGMYLQHFGQNERIGAIVAGNTTLLFVLCGGISYSIMAQRLKDRETEMTSFRARMLARAVFIDVIGYLLIMLNTGYGVILPSYAAMFVLALVLVHRSTRVLVMTAAALTVIAPPLMILGMSLLSEAYLLSDIAGGPMSALALAPAFVAGMAIGRLDLTRIRTALSLTVGGIVMFVGGKVLDAFVLPGLRPSFEAWLERVQGVVPMGYQPDLYAIWPLNTEPPLWHMLLSAAPHTASTFQTLIGLGLALLVLGLVCLVPKITSSVLLVPFAAVGRVALTMYAAQFIVIWSLKHAGIENGLEGIPLRDLLVVAVTLVTGWLIAWLPNGPLESLMRHFDRVFSASRTIPASR